MLFEVIIEFIVNGCNISDRKTITMILQGYFFLAPYNHQVTTQPISKICHDTRVRKLRYFIHVLASHKEVDTLLVAKIFN